MPDTGHAKTARLTLRMTPAAKRTLERAAAVNHQTVNAFVREKALMAAQEILADRRHFILNDAQWAEFNRLLDAPPEDNPGLRKLAERKPRWAN